jgi:hypothetical protein
MNVIESRVRLLEDGLARAWRAILNLIARMTRLEQQLASIPGGNGGGGGSGQNALFCAGPSSGTIVATGSWPTVTPDSFTSDVYFVQGTSITTLAAGATIYNWYMAALATGKVCYVVPDGLGNYVVVSQSCT